jgi:hypothetical protein
MAIRWFRKTPPEQISRRLKKIGWILAVVLLLVLLGSGRLNWFFAMLGVVIAFMLRMMPAILRYAPQLHRLWMLFSSGKQQHYQQQQSNRPPRGNGMSKAEALEVLGLKPDASEEHIIQAHRKLISKLHPDRGGSNYLAAQINLAKKTLLGH